MQYPYIDDDDGLRRYLESIAHAGPLAVDTEFVREKTYYPQLCLVQIATPESVACIDCLAELDLEPFFDRLLRDDSEWMVHSSRQDLEIVYLRTQRLPSRLIDTQVAAGLVGHPPQISLQDLLVRTLGVKLDKQYARTDWSRRPLPAAAIDYARDDVGSLHALWAALAAELDELGRRRWLEQDCGLLIAEPPVTTPEQVWQRLKGLRALDAAGIAAALALVEWREQRAQARDRPRRWILDDAPLAAIAGARPRSAGELSALPGVPRQLADRAGPEILAALAAAEAPSYRERAEQLAASQTPDKRRLKTLQRAVKEIAARLGIYPEILATKQELTELMSGRHPVRIAATWRASELRRLVDS